MSPGLRHILQPLHLDIISLYVQLNDNTETVLGVCCHPTECFERVLYVLACNLELFVKCFVYECDDTLLLLITLSHVNSDCNLQKALKYTLDLLVWSKNMIVCTVEINYGVQQATDNAIMCIHSLDQPACIHHVGSITSFVPS